MCSVECSGKKCRDCYTRKGKETEPLNLFEIASSQNLNGSMVQPNTNGMLFSNPSFSTDGRLSDILYTAATDVTGEIPTDAETFSLVHLITTMVMRETSPLRKEIENMKGENKKLREEIDAMKAERELLEAAAATGTVIPNETIETALQPYKDALTKLAPIEESLKNHQRYLDQDDMKKREMNVIITGVVEATIEARADGEEGEDIDTEENKDNQSIQEILQAIGCADVVPMKIKRLGARNEEEGGRPRPLLVVTDSLDTKRTILKRKMNLKEKGEQFKSVYIKQDEPLAVRREWKRLRDRMKIEKKAPTNIGTNIRIDFKNRVLLRDNVVIDTFESPFPKRGPNRSQ